jgi:hypothetical protein
MARSKHVNVTFGEKRILMTAILRALSVMRKGYSQGRKTLTERLKYFLTI